MHYKRNIVQNSTGSPETKETENSSKSKNNNIYIFRPVYTQHEFDQDHGGKYTEKPIKEQIINTFKKVKSKYFNSEGGKKFALSKFPFVPILMRYKWKTWLLLDLIAGLIVGTMQIPQSFAYAQLVGIQPIYGLYLAFFPVMVYYFFGSSRHISIGTIAIVSLLSGSFLEQSLIDFPLNTTKTVGNVSASVQNEAIKASRVAGLTLFVGISQLIMGVFNLGFLTKYLSDPLISGFTVGSAIIVFSTQLKYCFGVTIAKYYGIFSVWNTLIAVCKQLPNTNIPTFVLTAISIILLAVTKNVINPILMKKIHFPIPIELLVVVAGTVSSQYLDLHNKYNVSVVGTIIQGVPAPVIPVIDNMSNYISNIIVTAIIAFSVSISLGKMFAKKHGYKIDATQIIFMTITGDSLGIECVKREFIAFGLMNIFSSFFYCYPSAGSVSRSAVQEAAGGKTQITSLVSVILILFVLLFIGPLFQPLPNCILASVIIVALKSMLMKFVELKELWLFSIWDFSVWMVTFLFTIFLDVQYGLIAGVALSIISIVLRTQSPNSHILGQISGTDLYKNVAVYGDCHEIPGIKIFRYEGSIYYACKDHFKKSLYTKISYDPIMVKLRIQKIQKKIKKINQSLEEMENTDLIAKRAVFQEELDSLLNPNIHHIIIDCSTWGYIDIVGVKILHQVIEEYKNVNISVLLANPKTDVRRMFYRIETSQLIHDENIFVSVHDAVINSLYDHKIQIECL